VLAAPQAAALEAAARFYDGESVADMCSAPGCSTPATAVVCYLADAAGALGVVVEVALVLVAVLLVLLVLLVHHSAQGGRLCCVSTQPCSHSLALAAIVLQGMSQSCQ
jgi:hypothetical protein